MLTFRLRRRRKWRRRVRLFRLLPLCVASAVHPLQLQPHQSQHHKQRKTQRYALRNTRVKPSRRLSCVARQTMLCGGGGGVLWGGCCTDLTFCTIVVQDVANGNSGCIRGICCCYGRNPRSSQSLTKCHKSGQQFGDYCMP